MPDGITSITVEMTDDGEGTSSGSYLVIFKGDAADAFEAIVPAAKTTASLTTGVTAGDYFLQVNVADQRSYTVSVSFGEELYELEESNDLRATAQTVESDETYSGHDSNWAGGAEDDWFKVTIPEGVTTLGIDLADIGSGTSSGTSCTLFDASDALVGQVIAEASDTASQDIGVVAGEYFLQIHVADTRGYTLSVSF